jgi:hypothetical protein
VYALRSWSNRKIKNVGRELESARKKFSDLLEAGADEKIDIVPSSKVGFAQMSRWEWALLKCHFESKTTCYNA